MTDRPSVPEVITRAWRFRYNRRLQLRLLNSAISVSPSLILRVLRIDVHVVLYKNSLARLSDARRGLMTIMQLRAVIPSPHMGRQGNTSAFHGFTAPCSSVERKNVDPECFRCTWISIAFDRQLGKNREKRKRRTNSWRTFESYAVHRVSSLSRFSLFPKHSRFNLKSESIINQ